MMRNPCWNVDTNTDCPNRHMGCSIDCPKWAEFEKEKKRIYAIRAKERQAAHDRAGITSVYTTRYIKSVIANRANRANKNYKH